MWWWWGNTHGIRFYGRKLFNDSNRLLSFYKCACVCVCVCVFQIRISCVRYKGTHELVLASNGKIIERS